MDYRKLQPKATYFSLREFERSQTAIDLNIGNAIPPAQIQNITKLISTVLNPARALLGAPIIVTSGYRSPRLNKAVGGAKNSYHMRGRAADITTQKKEQLDDLYNILKNLPHTELIRYKTFIHVAL